MQKNVRVISMSRGFRSVRWERTKGRSLLVPMLVFAAALTVGMDDCEPPPPPINCQGQVPTHIFSSLEEEATAFWGTGEDDVIVLLGGPGPRTVHGGLGNDLICVRWNAANVDDITIYGGEGDDAVYGSDAAETIYGGEGNDVLNGYGGDDRIEGE